jgi:copper chaperone
MQETLTLSIEGMHCGACVRRVTNALQAVPGVAVDSVEVGSAKLAFDPEETTAQEIAAAVDGIGFTATVAR